MDSQNPQSSISTDPGKELSATSTSSPADPTTPDAVEEPSGQLNRCEFLATLGAGAVAEIVGKGSRQAVVGIGFGLVAYILSTLLLSSMLFEVKRTDPSTYIVTSAFLLTWIMMAIWLPARRATKVDPLAALREE